MAGPATASESATAPANPNFVIIVLLSARDVIHRLPASGAAHPQAAHFAEYGVQPSTWQAPNSPASRSNAQNRKQGFSVFLKFHLCGRDGDTSMPTG
jgi:hypothetical protein